MISIDHPIATKIRKQMVEAIARFRLIEEGDKVMVCVSGGKDSAILTAILKEIMRRAPYTFTVEAVMLDQGQPGFQPKPFVQWIQALDVPFTMVSENTYAIVKEKITDGVYCSLCSRLRRGILYDHAFKNNFSKMALGHHRDDSNQTLLMNMFYTGKISAMPPKLKSDDGRNILIRPMILVSESDIEQLSKDWQIPILPCNLCGSQEGMKRQRVKSLLRDLEKEIPYLQHSIAKATSNIKSSQMMDAKLWDFEGLSKDVEPSERAVDPFEGY